jgi:hypothetical protein
LAVGVRIFMGLKPSKKIRKQKKEDDEWILKS